MCQAKKRKLEAGHKMPWQLERPIALSPWQFVVQAQGKAAAKAEAKKRPKIKKKYSGLSKEDAWLLVGLRILKTGFLDW